MRKRRRRLTWNVFSQPGYDVNLGQLKRKFGAGVEAAQTQEYFRKEFYNPLFGTPDEAEYKAWMCPRCFTGPVTNEKCFDLQAHHEERVEGSSSTTSNACAHCNFFSAEQRGWAPWDGIYRIAGKPVAAFAPQLKLHLDKMTAFENGAEWHPPLSAPHLFSLGSHHPPTRTPFSALSSPSVTYAESHPRVRWSRHTARACLCAPRPGCVDHLPPTDHTAARVWSLSPSAACQARATSRSHE